MKTEWFVRGHVRDGCQSPETVGNTLSDRSLIPFFNHENEHPGAPHSTMGSRKARKISLLTGNSIRVAARESRGAQSFPVYPADPESDLRGLRNACNLLAEVYNEFAHESSIHGLRYTGRHKSALGRIFWLFVIIVSVIAAGVLAQKFHQRHKQATMRTLVVSSQFPAWRIPIPAVTICHPNVASAHRLQQYENEGNKIELPYGMAWTDFMKDLEFVQEIYIPTNHFQNAMVRLNSVMVHNNLTMTEFFEILSPSCDDYLVWCQLQDEMKACYHFVKTSKTAYGICCSFNYAHAEGYTRWAQGEELYSHFFGHNYIFSVILKSYGPEDRICGLTYGDGARVLIHDSHTYPGPSAREFIARQGSEMIAYLYGRVLTASPEVLDLPRKERDCRSSQTEDGIYKLDNCVTACHEKLFRSYCNCVPYYASFVREHETVCNFTHVSCLSKVKARVLQTPIREEPCNCLPTCDGTDFAVVTTVVPMNAAQHNPSRFYRVAAKYPNATAIHITFPRQTGMKFRRDLVLSWINLVSSLGGVFSLFLGCSVVSVFEILYFIIYYIVKVMRSRETNLQRT
ncbi:sodium channel protein Nach [Diachasma alloeum]|uniref:sodium channel protein Nach n=1 Tax=Diachasma alloeum TaxID=454923 RepID=UPI0007384C2C|nr:sodium channel protein Nach [Diachasma alloeum]